VLKLRSYAATVLTCGRWFDAKPVIRFAPPFLGDLHAHTCMQRAALFMTCIVEA
jgi:hypothetical protein